MSYVDRVQECDQCQLGGHAELGELLPDGWLRTVGGATYCSKRCEALAQGRPVPRALPVAPALLRACRTCGHDLDVHTHHRPGTDCSLCPCPRFRR